MSISAIASLRPIRGNCLASARTGLLSVRIAPRNAPCFTMRAAVPLQLASRNYSTKPESKPTGASGAPSADGAPKASRPVGNKISFRQFVGRLFVVSIRNAFTRLSPTSIKQAYRENPVRIGGLMSLLIFGFLFGAVGVKKFINDFYNPYFSAFPEPVATTLRRAIYYTNYKPDPELALKYYKRALEESTQIGMHPFSDEVLGIRIQVSAWLQKIGSYESAIEVLQSLLKDCNGWIKLMDEHVADGRINADGRLVSNLEKQKAATEGKGDAKDALDPPETLWRTRERVLAKSVAISTKLGEVYASEHVLEPEKSHEYLLWAVETGLKEFARRRQEAPRPGEKSWLSPEEMGGAMESLGNDYERKSQFHLAIPLFFHALRLCDSPCHRVTIMNNLAATFAQFPIYSPTAPAYDSVVTPEALKAILDSSMPTSRQECLEAGMNWARNAYQHSKDVKGEERTPECDEACAVALVNWADIARLLSKPELSRKKYEQAIQMSKKMEFAEGVRNAQEGLKKLAEGPPPPLKTAPSSPVRGRS